MNNNIGYGVNPQEQQNNVGYGVNPQPQMNNVDPNMVQNNNSTNNNNKIIIIAGVIVVAAIFIGFMFFGDGDSLSCTKEESGTVTTYKYKFKDNKVTEMSVLMDIEADDEEDAKEGCDILKTTLEGQNFKVNCTTNGKKVKVDASVSADDALKSGIIKEKDANKTGTKKNLEDAGWKCK